MDHITSRIFQQKDSSYKFLFCIKVSTSPGIVPQVSEMCGQNIKINEMCQILMEILERYVISNSRNQISKMHAEKQKNKKYRKTSQRWMNACNTAILKLWNFSGKFNFKLRSFVSSFEYFYCWQWGVSPRH